MSFIRIFYLLFFKVDVSEVFSLLLQGLERVNEGSTKRHSLMSPISVLVGVRIYYNFPSAAELFALTQGFLNFSDSRRLFSIKIFPCRPALSKSTYIKTNTVFLLSKYSCIRIDKNIFGINSLFFSENKKFRPQGGTHCIHFRFFRGCQSYIFSVYVCKIVGKR